MKRILKAFGIILLALIGYAGYYVFSAIPLGTGHTAKYVCSKVFLGGKDPESVFREEVEPANPLLLLIDYKIDRKEQSVSSFGIGGIAFTKAVFRPGFGCTLTTKTTRGELVTQAGPAARPLPLDPQKEWPAGDRVELDNIPPEVDSDRLQRSLADAFKEPGPDTRRNTHAVVVVYRNRIIAEKYASGITPHTPLLGWSMTKSWTNALIGILVKEGSLDITKPAPIAAWKNDERRAITLDQLLRMSSGLEFEEYYTPGSDAMDMFYTSQSMGGFAAEKQLRTEPDGEWSYSSGTTNILCRIISNTVGSSLGDLDRFTRQKFFNRLGMNTSLIEPDPSGVWVGSSYGFGSARDWARSGLLYLNDGYWQGEQILPTGWVEYSTTPTPLAPYGGYGAQFWLNAGEKGNPQNRDFPSLPRDLYYMSGHNDQIVAIIPSKKLVVVRLGVTMDDSWDVERFLKSIIDSIDS